MTVWDGPNDENRFTREAWGAQMELRAIQCRNREAIIKARQKGRVKAKPSYGYEFIRLAPCHRGPLSPAPSRLHRHPEGCPADPLRPRADHPSSLSSWLLTTRDPSVAEAVAEVFRIDEPQTSEAGGGFGVVLGGDTVTIVVTEIGSEVNLMVRGEGPKAHICDGERFLEPGAHGGCRRAE
ncbi:hypothetical protein ACFVIM_00150 [Streptomyces sp. NPDC057638]|uniref:hypothetical protein n=1 Tax=Streptomyces sp. NPDC057638 TaxID=3346190 RepID=UPI00367A18C8